MTLEWPHGELPLLHFHELDAITTPYTKRSADANRNGNPSSRVVNLGIRVWQSE